MVSFALVGLLTSALLSRTAAAIPVEAVVAPPAVDVGPEPADLPTTLVPSPALVAARDESRLQKRVTTQIQFWKDTHFRGQYILATLETGPCYQFTGTWTEWDNAISSINVMSGGPCRLYDGLFCDVESLGPISYTVPIAELSLFGWDNKFSSLRC